MNLLVLGSGTLCPRVQRSSAAYLLRVGSERVLVDCGSGTLRRLLELGEDYGAIDRVCFTHLHVDHTADLAPLLFAYRWDRRARRQRALTLHGGPGFLEWIAALDQLYEGGLLKTDYPLQLESYGERPISASGYALRTAAVNHAPHSRALRFEEDGGATAVFTGDSGPSRELEELAQEADLLVAECSFPDAISVPGHLTPTSVGELAARARPRRLLLTHLYPEVDTPDLADRVREKFGGDVGVAQDRMLVRITRRSRR
ncbi:MAG TPA: MBL fold metallo-hydrolase [Acidobacteriota bacterium]